MVVKYSQPEWKLRKTSKIIRQLKIMNDEAGKERILLASELEKIKSGLKLR